MLNRVIEKAQRSALSTGPQRRRGRWAFRDTRVLVTLLSEDIKSYYTTRVLELQNISTGEKREIYHFHYTTWPDFGVPDSPCGSRERWGGTTDRRWCTAALEIGRSGTFSLVDTCVVLMDKRKDPSSVDIKSTLLDMRKHRMGLIQTPDQLRFSFMAVLEGSKWHQGRFLCTGTCTITAGGELSREDQEPILESPPSTQPQARCPTERCNGNQRGGQQEEGGDYRQDDRAPAPSPCKEQEQDGGTTHKRRREDSISKSGTAKTTQSKPRTNDSEKKRKR
ncbi:hypothetical protein KUCAC02_010784 [Chaenocephalus aceratus]|uniref:Uncharacterized protein n=1 Tax=Chaenocephalus aceratus TaxID=36190 RepID=A0ACB9WTR9_CHAAC|nr:hypothetical protein KUCAC02_010784 [Chaenocephalus aceratus]